MLYIKQKELVEKETKLQEEMKEAIICTLKANNGRFTYTSPDIDDEDAAFEDKYPVVSTLWGKHGTYNIAITDVYLVDSASGQSEIYVDGIDQDTETVQKGFMVYPPQFSDIIYFLMTPVSHRIYEYASRLALKELVDKYSLLPASFFNRDGVILDQYNNERYSLIQKNKGIIESLMKDISKAKTQADKDEIHSRIMEMADDLSTLNLIESQGRPEEEMMVEENECFYFTEEYQDKFNDIYDEVEAELNDFFQFEYN